MSANIRLFDTAAQDAKPVVATDDLVAFREQPDGSRQPVPIEVNDFQSLIAGLITHQISFDTHAINAAITEYIERFALKSQTTPVPTAKLPYASATQDGIISSAQFDQIGKSVSTDLNAPQVAESNIRPNDGVLFDANNERENKLREITFSELDKRYDQRDKQDAFGNKLELRDGSVDPRVDIGNDVYQAISFDAGKNLPTDQNDPLFIRIWATDNNDDRTYKVYLRDLKEGTHSQPATAADWYVLENAIDGRNVYIAKDPNHTDRLLIQISGDGLRSARVDISYAPHIAYLVKGISIDTTAFKLSYTVRVGGQETVTTIDIPKTNAATHTQPSRIIYDHTLTRQGFYEAAVNSKPYTSVSFPLDFIQSATDKVELWHNQSQINRLAPRAAGSAATQSTGLTINGLNDEELSFVRTSGNDILVAALDADGVGTRVRVEVREQTHLGPTPDSLIAETYTNTSDTQYEFAVVGTLVVPTTGFGEVWIDGVKQEAKLNLKALDDLTDGTLNGDATTNNIEYDYDGFEVYFNKNAAGNMLAGTNLDSGQTEILVRLEPDIPEGRTDADILRTVFTKLSESAEFTYDTNTGLVSVSLTFADITGTIKTNQIGDQQVTDAKMATGTLRARSVADNELPPTKFTAEVQAAITAAENTQQFAKDTTTRIPANKLPTTLDTMFGTFKRVNLVSATQARQDATTGLTFYTVGRAFAYNSQQFDVGDIFIKVSNAYVKLHSAEHPFAFSLGVTFPSQPVNSQLLELTADATLPSFDDESGSASTAGFEGDVFQYNASTRRWARRLSPAKFRAAAWARLNDTSLVPYNKVGLQRNVDLATAEGLADGTAYIDDTGLLVVKNDGVSKQYLPLEDDPADDFPNFQNLTTPTGAVFYFPVRRQTNALRHDITLTFGPLETHTVAAGGGQTRTYEYSIGTLSGIVAGMPRVIAHADVLRGRALSYLASQQNLFDTPRQRAVSIWRWY